MTVGNRYELIDFQLYQAQAVLNVYYYLQISGVLGNAADMYSAWNTLVYPAILEIQASGLTHVSTTVRNLDDLADFDLVPRVPADPGHYLSPGDLKFVAASFMLHRQTLAVRNGWKRFGGLPDNEIVNGAPSVGYLAGLNALAVVLDDNIAGTSGAVYEPRIMRKVTDPVLHITTYTDFPMGLAEFRGITTQNTRKR